MIPAGVFLMALAFLGASAKPEPDNSFQSSFKIINGGCRSSLPTVKTHIRTSVVENPPIAFPAFISPTSVTQSCHCMRTVLRPQIRNEIITVPTVDRIVRTVASPIVETVETTPLGAFARQSVLSEPNGNPGGVFQDDISTFRGSNNEMFGEGNARSFSTCQSSKSANGGSLNKSSGLSGGLISQPHISTFQNVNGKNFLGPGGTIFSENAGYLNNERILGF